MSACALTVLVMYDHCIVFHNFSDGFIFTCAELMLSVMSSVKYHAHIA